MKYYNIEQIRKYLQSQDSFGDALYNLKEENIDKANEPEDDGMVTPEEASYLYEDEERIHPDDWDLLG